MPDYLVIIALIGYIVYDRLSKAYKEGKLQDKKEAILLVVSYVVVISSIIFLVYTGIIGSYIWINNHGNMPENSTFFDNVCGIISCIWYGIIIIIAVIYFICCFNMVGCHIKGKIK